MPRPAEAGFDFNQVAKQDLETYQKLPGSIGEVYLLQGKPFLQLHIFPDSYTLFWPSKPNGSSTIEATEQVLKEGWRQWWKVSGRKESHLYLSAVVNTKQSLKEQERTLGIPESAGEEIITQQLGPFVRPLWSKLASLYLGIYSGPLTDDPDYEFSVWLDGKKTPARGGRETGIEAKLGIVPLNTLPELIKTTSQRLKTANPEQLSEFLESIASEHRLGHLSSRP